MRAIRACGLLLPLLLVVAGCPNDDLTGECVPGFDYTEEAQIIPSQSPFYFCPTDPVPSQHTCPWTPQGQSESCTYGNLILNNCGRQALEIESFDITTADTSDVFRDLEIPETSVQPGDSTAARFIYVAAEIDELHHGTITINSNAVNHPTLEIDLLVRADEPFDGGFCAPVRGGGSEDAGQ